MIIDIFVVLFVIAVFVMFGRRQYKNKKQGVIGCAHCKGCSHESSCDSRK